MFAVVLDATKRDFKDFKVVLAGKTQLPDCHRLLGFGNLVFPLIWAGTAVVAGL